MNDILDEPVELSAEDLEAVSGGAAIFNFNNFAPNEGTQLTGLTGGITVLPDGSVVIG